MVSGEARKGSVVKTKLAWDQDPQWGKKEKKNSTWAKKEKIGERSELKGSLGRGKDGAALSVFPGHRSNRFAR